MKQCTKCQSILPTTDFNWKNKSLNILQSCCKTCSRKAASTSYFKNKAHYVTNAIKRNVQRSDDNKSWIASLNLKCTKCNEDHPAVLDFHHTNPTEKEHNVSRMLASGISRSAIIKEMSKCVILCSNCHRKHHWNERQF